MTIADGPAVEAHDGLLAARYDEAGQRLLTSGEDGRVLAISADGGVDELVHLKGKWIDKLAIGPQGAVALAAGRTAWVRLKGGTLTE
ncbi:hypothetical protein J8J27_27465, partial [Mycobacterium tuberculosis]|nr:hypothetical protein [Mycobacterium tuberculosis]